MAQLAVELRQLILDDAVVVIAVLAAVDAGAIGGDLRAAPALRAGQQDRAEIAVIDVVRKSGAARARIEPDRVGRADPGTAGPRIAFDRQFVAIGFGIGGVEHRIPAVVTLVRGVPAERIELGMTLERIVAQHTLDARERALRDQAVRYGVTRVEGGTRPIERQFDPALDVVVLEVRIERVDRAGQIGGNAHFERALQPQPLEPA